MNDAEQSQQTAAPRSPLCTLLPETAQAETVVAGGRQIVAHFGDVADEVRALREAAALVDAGSLDWIAVRGDDARDFLHRMLSQDVAAMPAASVAHACLLDRKGGLIAPMRVWHSQEPAPHYLLELPGETCAAVSETLDKFIIADDVELTDESATHTAMAILGPKRDAVLAELGWQAPPPGGVVVRVESEAGEVSLADAPLGALPGALLRMPVAATLEQLVPHLRDAVQAVGGRLAGFAAYDAVRVEQGQPRWNAELRPGLLAKEAGLEAGVSYTKGCYPGQEPTYRLHFRGQPSKRLMRLRPAAAVPGTEYPETALPLPLYSSEGKEAGTVTSLVSMPGTGEVVALGYVRRAYLEAKPPLHLGNPNAPIQLIPHDQAGPS